MRIKRGLVVSVTRPQVASPEGTWQVQVVVPIVRIIDGVKKVFKYKKIVFTNEQVKLHSWIEFQAL